MGIMTETEAQNPGGKTEKISDRVARKILKQISDGELMPGKRLPGERQLAESLGVSRVSVRAALQALKAQGYLEAVQGGGTRVISSALEMDGPLTGLIKTNAENFHDLSEIRADLEVWAARRAALHATDEDISELENAVVAVAKARGKDKVVENVNFHYAVARASGSTIYMHLFNVIRDVLTDTVELHHDGTASDYMDETLLNEQHEAVCQAIKNRDPEAAAKAMAHHLSSVLERLDSERKKQAAEAAVANGDTEPL